MSMTKMVGKIYMHIYFSLDILSSGFGVGPVGVMSRTDGRPELALARLIQATGHIKMSVALGRSFDASFHLDARLGKLELYS